MQEDLQSIIEVIRKAYPEKTLVDISEYEDENHQSYKFLFEGKKAEAEQQLEELYSLRFQMQDREREIASLNEELMKQKAVNSKLNNTTVTVMEFIKKFTTNDIVISDIRAIDNSDNEIITENENQPSANLAQSEGMNAVCKRPNWFMPLPREFNKNNVAKKCADNTSGFLKWRLNIFDRLFKIEKESKLTQEQIHMIGLMERKKEIEKLLNSDCSNEEKYLKYLLLSPKMPKDFMNTFLGASDLGLSANVVISLLEQPEELFNQEIIEIYISRLHKGNEYNLKKELVTELIRGEWYAVADINGERQKFQMVPIKHLEELRDKLEKIYEALSSMADDEVCASLTQTSSDSFCYDEDFFDYPQEEKTSSFINFDDSMLNDGEN